MNRRKLLKSAIYTGASISLSQGVPGLTARAVSASRPDLVVAHGSSPAGITRSAVEALGGIRSFISRGDVVVVKPNIAWDRIPEQAATSNPEVVATVVKLCLEAGAKKVMIFDRPVNDPRRCYVQSGISAAIKPLGAELKYMDERKFREVSIKGDALKSWPLYTEIFEADKLINLPIAKHHGLAKLTLSMKNWMGVMGGSRRGIHQKLDESLADLSLVIKPTLTVLDAVRILTANGPQGGSLTDVKKTDIVIAGVDQVTIDSYGATLFGLRGSDLGYVKAAHRRGLGTLDLSKLFIKKIGL